MSWKRIQKDVSRWAQKTFPHQTPYSKIAHLKEEIEEVKRIMQTVDSAITKDFSRKLELTEFADCQILLLNLCQMRGITPRKLKRAVRAKMKINKQREWGEPDAEGVCHHIKK